MKTRQEYLDQKVTHDEYYSQFVTDCIYLAVFNRFNKALLKSAYSEDKSFNTIPLRFWDSLANNNLHLFYSIKDHLALCGEINTLAVRVRILKQAARQIATSEIVKRQERV